MKGIIVQRNYVLSKTIQDFMNQETIDDLGCFMEEYKDRYGHLFDQINDNPLNEQQTKGTIENN